ncbi:Signal peptidase complex subunit [Dinochytrium kinnereticum]|nr:Signal peptidase complex subunit [Dinochytrium kinnereticum]
MGRVGYYYDYSQPLAELATIHFNMDADMTELFNWNTKQLFVFVVVDYATKTHGTNQIVIWDNIITSKDQARIILKNQKPEYLASDINHRIRGLPANISLHWDIIPHVGMLQLDRKGSQTFKF